MRKLASIQRILSLTAIPGADRIEVATILGWKVVVKKGEFNVGEFCVYCEVDSILPELPEFEFLREKHFRIKTIQLKKQVSQGIVFPLSILGEDNKYVEGDDVTDVIGIKKYEVEYKDSLGGQTKGVFPSFIQKTDEERIQTCYEEMLSNIVPEEWYVTEKLDGTSTTCYYRDGEVGICSRNTEYKLENEHNLYVNMFKKLEIDKWLLSYKKNISIQGEVIGSGIQGNKYGFPVNEKTVRWFSVFDINSHKYLLVDQLIDIIGSFGLTTVPILDLKFTPSTDIEKLVEYSKGRSVLNNSIHREGVVIRNKKDGRSFKVINPDFLLKYD